MDRRGLASSRDREEQALKWGARAELERCVAQEDARLAERRAGEAEAEARRIGGE